MDTNKKFLEVYPDYDISKLPSFIRENINLVYVSGKKNKTLILPDGRKYYLDNKLNDLTGSEWTYFTNSVINTSYNTTGKDNDGFKFRKIHPSPKPPALLKEIITFFTKEGDLVFDYFAGVGGTLLASSMSNRRCIGIELNDEYISAYKKANDYLKLDEQIMILGDSNVLLGSEQINNLFNNEKASLILIDPPYFNMMARPKTADDIERYGHNGTPFTAQKEDLGNMNEDEFWNTLISIIEKSLFYLKDKGHIVVFIKDLQPKGKINNLLHAQMIERITSLNSIYYLGMKIWADQTAKLFPYGYPYSFVATQIHQYILIFKKRA